MLAGWQLTDAVHHSYLVFQLLLLYYFYESKLRHNLDVYARQLKLEKTVCRVKHFVPEHPLI